MNRWIKWLVVPLVLAGVLFVGQERSAQAGPWRVHVGVGWGWGGYYPYHHHHVYHPGHFHYHPGHFHYSPWGAYYHPGHYHYHPGHWHSFCD